MPDRSTPSLHPQAKKSGRPVRWARWTAAAVATLAAGAAQAQVSFSLTPSIGRAAYELQLDSDRTLDGNARVLGLSADLGLPNGFFLGLSHTRMSGDGLRLEGEETGLGWSRNDTALTVNHALVDDLNIFIGLRTGGTQVDSGIGTEFKTRGYFVGLALPLQIGSGFLSLSAAVGLNEGTWRDVEGDATDKAVGYSAGLRYSHPISEGINAGVGFKTQRYVYTLENVGLGDVREKFNQFDVFVSFSF